MGFSCVDCRYKKCSSLISGSYYQNVQKFFSGDGKSIDFEMNMGSERSNFHVDQCIPSLSCMLIAVSVLLRDLYTLSLVLLFAAIRTS